MPPAETTNPANAPLHGEVVYFYAFDIAYDMRRTGLEKLLGSPLEPYQIHARKRGPRGQSFYRPLMAGLPEMQRTIRGKTVPVQAAVKVLPVGALSVMVRVPFAVSALEELGHWHAPVFDEGGTLEQWVIETVERARTELAPYAVRPHEKLPEGETYTVFCLDTASPGIGDSAPAWLETHRSGVGALLTREPDAAALSSQEIAESTSRWLSYYRHDVVVTDWDASFVIDRPDDFDETLYIMELANVQLEELEAYDAFIDDALERAYRDLSGSRPPGRGDILRELKELRIDLSRFSDELSNITKFFGEWHLARVYENTARVFHLGDWHRAIDEKLKTLDSLYEMLKQDQNHRVMVWLEVGIVLLFVIDVVMIFLGMGK
ncbi:MAG TPA: hypothetical protein VHM91_08750 [Verrucomicrobiales bacterium]|jgi:hypothetical protein|nr:hypothetical protein [Verrucomicrobiales bacterium]